MSAHLLMIIVSVLSWVESPRGPGVMPGPAGETGDWQLTPAVRQDRGRELRARGERVTDETLARAQVVWIDRELRRHGMTPTPYAIAEAWNAGLTATVEHRVPAASRDFADRVRNLVEERR